MGTSRMKRSYIRMDMESPYSIPIFDLTEKNEILRHQQTQYDRIMTSSSTFAIEKNNGNVVCFEKAYGMPWEKSIQQNENCNPSLLYMSFWKWQMSFMKENLSNLHIIP